MKEKTKSQKICLIIALILFIAAGFMCFWAFNNGSRSVRAAFDREKQAAEESIYNSYYEKGFQAGEEAYHVKNRAVISLSNIRETSNLEVLSVSDIAFMIEEPGIDNKNIQSWLEVPGTGVFTVDLSAGEYLVDDERTMVFVRVPKPELLPMNISIDHANIKILRFVSNGWKTSIRDGEQMAEKQLNEARTFIQEDILSNLQYYEYAEKSARSLLENLIRAVNKEIPDLKVEIEFF